MKFLNKLFSRLPPLGILNSQGRSLKTVLALFFVPLSVLPTLVVSFYAFNLLRQNANQNFSQRAQSERDAIVAELEALDAAFVSSLRSLSQTPGLGSLLQKGAEKELEKWMAAANFRPMALRLYTLSGNLVGSYAQGVLKTQVPYISSEGLKTIRETGESLTRFPDLKSQGIRQVGRILVQKQWVLEGEAIFGAKELAELKLRRQVDIVLLDHRLQAFGASFALSAEALQKFSVGAFQRAALGSTEPTTVTLGEGHYAGFLYNLPSGKNRKWGFLGVFLPTASLESALRRMALALFSASIFLIVAVGGLIILLSNRIVKPLESLVLAMKQLKTGRVEQLPPLDAPYEIEYLVMAFNDMVRNVTAAKQALEIKLRELELANRELKNTQATLIQSAKMISLGQLVAGVAHELNNPIAFIYSNMQSLADYVNRIREWYALVQRFQEKLPQIEREALAEKSQALDLEFILKDVGELTRSCLEGANRTKEIVLGLRTFSRVEESTFKAADLREGIQNTLKLLSGEFKDRIEVHTEYGELPLVECNLSQMNQVFMNLLSNAGQAILGRGHIWVRTRMEEGFAIVEIEDSGSGMAPEVLEKVFDPFFTTKQVGQGTGLGLSIAYGLVQKHKGTIAVRSTPGKGSCFTIRIPLQHH